MNNEGCRLTIHQPASSDHQQSAYFREEGRHFVNEKRDEKELIESGHGEPFNVLNGSGQEALFPHVFNSKHTCIT